MKWVNKCNHYGLFWGKHLDSGLWVRTYGNTSCRFFRFMFEWTNTGPYLYLALWRLRFRIEPSREVKK